MKIIILEDENLAANRLEKMILDIMPEADIISKFESVQELAQYLIDNQHPDLLFLDIQVEDGTSFELFELVDVESQVIFATAYNEYAIEALRNNALDYLLKPVKKGELKSALEKAKKNETSGTKNIEGFPDKSVRNRFLIRFGNKLHVVKTVELAYIYTENKISYFVRNDGSRVPSDYRLQELEELLDDNQFFRLNRQVIAHIDAIDEILSYSKSRLRVILDPPFDSRIIVSTEKTPLFKKWLEH